MGITLSRDVQQLISNLSLGSLHYHQPPYYPAMSIRGFRAVRVPYTLTEDGILTVDLKSKLLLIITNRILLREDGDHVVMVGKTTIHQYRAILGLSPSLSKDHSTNGPIERITLTELGWAQCRGLTLIQGWAAPMNLMLDTPSIFAISDVILAIQSYDIFHDASHKITPVLSLASTTTTSSPTTVADEPPAHSVQPDDTILDASQHTEESPSQLRTPSDTVLTFCAGVLNGGAERYPNLDEEQYFGLLHSAIQQHLRFSKINRQARSSSSQ